MIFETKKGVFFDRILFGGYRKITYDYKQIQSYIKLKG